MQAHAVRTLAVTHPRIFPLVATRPPSAPWLRPPLRSLRWVESFLQGLREYGFSPRVSVAVYRSFATFLLGALLLEAGTLEDLTITEKVNLAFIETDDLSSYPIISEMADGAEGRRLRGRVRGRAGGPDRAGRGDAHLACLAGA